MFSLTEKRKHIRQVHTWNFDYNIVSTSNHSYLLLFHTQPIYKEAIVLKKCLTFTTLELNVGYAMQSHYVKFRYIRSHNIFVLQVQSS